MAQQRKHKTKNKRQAQSVKRKNSAKKEQGKQQKMQDFSSI